MIRQCHRLRQWNFLAILCRAWPGTGLRCTQLPATMIPVSGWLSDAGSWRARAYTWRVSMAERLPPIRQWDEYGPVNFYLMPFLKPGRVKRWFGQVESYEDAVRAVLKAAAVDFSHRNVLVAHQFVTAGGQGPERSDSEMDPIAVGGAYNLDVSALEGFDYVALGHIHRPQAIGRPTVRYAGSPLKYSFSEARHEKSVTLVEIKEKGQVELTVLPLAPKRDMLVVEGPLEALLSAGAPSDCFVRAILTDEGPVLDAAAV